MALDLFEATLPGKTGIGVYADNLARALFAENGDMRFTGFIKRGTAKIPPGDGHKIVEVPTPGHNRTLWSQIALPMALRAERPDLLHVPGHRIPIFSQGVPVIATIHDLAYRVHPESFRPLHRLRLRRFTEWTIRKARRLIAVSSQTKQDLMRFYRVPESKIDVVAHGVAPSFVPLRNEEALMAFRKKWGLPLRYVLHLGSLQPRKNLPRLLEAWRIALPQLGDPAALVLIGKIGWGMKAFFEEAANELGTGKIIYLGYLPDEEMPTAIAAAAALVMPSLYEGFGFPVLEAMACRVPVACSGTSSLAEVAGDCAELFDPLSIGEMAKALETLLENPAQARCLAAKGLERAKQFTWRTSALATMASYRRA